MSLILEALNRARQEQHSAAPVPGVDSEHYYPAAEGNPWRQRGLLGALAVALLVIGVLLGNQFSRDRNEAPTATTALPAALAEAPVSPPAPIPVATITAPEAGNTPGSQKETEISAAPEAVTVVSEPVAATPPAQVPPPAMTGSGDRAEIAALYQQTTAAPKPQEGTAATEPVPSRGESLDVASLLTAAEQALDDVRLAEHPAPFLADLSQQGKDAVPTLMYLQHDYRAAGGSTVTINGDQVRAGESVGRGVTVEEILPDSVVLTHAGQQFRLRALNSWVNL